MRGIYKIAEHVVEFISIYEDVHLLCKDYQSKQAPDFTISIAREDINYEKSQIVEKDSNYYSDGYIETLAVYRKLTEKLIDDNILLIHGSAIALDGVAYLFTAKSGTGKSTHTRLWRQYFGKRAEMMNDDKPLLKIEEDKVIVFGTPWSGKHKLSANISVPLHAICFLNRRSYNIIDHIDKKQVLPLLLQHTYRPRDAELLSKTLSLLDKLVHCVEFYSLFCNQDLDAASVSYEGMCRKER